MRKPSVLNVLVVFILGLFPALVNAQAPPPPQPVLIAVGELTQTDAGTFLDLSGLTNTLENGDPANILGGLGSGLAWASGNTFLALPDRGPNAVNFADVNEGTALDNTVTYIPRFHTITMDLQENKGPGLPFTLVPRLRSTTLLYSSDALVYGAAVPALNIPSGVPLQNTASKHFFTGRSDAFDPHQTSGNPLDARMDSESIRVSNDGKHVYISDEYGPYVYEFDRSSGKRTRSFQLPAHLFVSNLNSIGATEISGNTSGRTANKGMEGLAITPDGKTLVGIVQAALIQDAALGKAAKKLLRIEVIDLESGQTIHEFAYGLTDGSGVSEITALNNHEFLVDERDGDGRANGDAAVVKEIFKIDLNGAVDVSGMNGTNAAANEVPKTLFLDVVKALVNAGFDPTLIPAKIEGVALGQDITQGPGRMHTLWVANDNDFLATVPDPNGNPVANTNQFFVFGFTDASLNGSELVLQKISGN
ncbi:MAG TPA: esterase-like activity of phytase family protein [Candidatus Angelobacter sp.]|nr:esterase-like activity of phytase family protein [Candidatus Angelobacter sp.]